MGQRAEGLCAEGEGRQLKISVELRVFEQRTLFLRRLFAAALGHFRALCHFRRHSADVPLVRAQTRYFLVLARLHLVRPRRRARRRGFQCGDLLLQARALLRFGGVGGGFIPPPVGKAPFAQFVSLRVQCQNVIAAAVQKIAVVRNEDKPALCGEVGAEFFSSTFVKVVGRLVDERKGVFLCEQRGEQNLRAFAARKGAKRPFERFLADAELVQLRL